MPREWEDRRIRVDVVEVAGPCLPGRRDALLARALQPIGSMSLASMRPASLLLTLACSPALAACDAGPAAEPTANGSADTKAAPARAPRASGPARDLDDTNAATTDSGRIVFGLGEAASGFGLAAAAASEDMVVLAALLRSARRVAPPTWQGEELVLPNVPPVGQAGLLRAKVWNATAAAVAGRA